MICIALWKPKFDGNIGGALRAAHVFGADAVSIIGSRTATKRLERHKHKIEPTDTTKAHRHVPVFFVDTLYEAVPHGAMLVGVEVGGKIPLPKFHHPESACYLFGPEDGDLPMEMYDCTVSIATAYCMNLAAAVNVVLYDRMAKAKTTPA